MGQIVAIYFDVPLTGLLRTKRGRGRKNLPRWIAMKLCQEVGGAKLSDIAKEFQVGHYSTVSQPISRLYRQLNGDARTRQAFNMLSQDLTP